MATRKKPAKKKAPAKKVSHAKVVQTMYLDFMRLAGLTPKIVMKKKPPAKKKPPEKVFVPHKTVAVRTKKKRFVPMPPRRRDIPIGGIASLGPSTRGHPEPRETMPVSKHWRYFDYETREPVAPWDIELGPHTAAYAADEELDVDDADEGVFADEDYSYADFEDDWGGYDHQDTGYADENA